MEQIKMQPNTQFKINSIEELKQAWKSSEEPLVTLQQEIDCFNESPNNRYWSTNQSGTSWLSSYKYIKIKMLPNPFKKQKIFNASEYPKEMLVWDNVPQRKKVVTIIGKFHGQYMTKGEDDCIYGFKNAKDIDAPTENIINPKETNEDKTVSLLEAINEKLSIIIENTN